MKKSGPALIMRLIVAKKRVKIAVFCFFSEKFSPPGRFKVFIP